MLTTTKKQKRKHANTFLYFQTFFFFYWKRELCSFEMDKIATENNKTVNNFKVDCRYGTKV